MDSNNRGVSPLWHMCYSLLWQHAAYQAELACRLCGKRSANDCQLSLLFE
jgi:hypothetical protein